MIYFLDTFSGTKIPFNRVYNMHEDWYKKLPSNLRLMYEGEEEGELREDYVDMVDLLYWYRNNNTCYKYEQDFEFCIPNFPIGTDCGAFSKVL